MLRVLTRAARHVRHIEVCLAFQGREDLGNGHGVVEFPLLNLIKYRIHSLLAVPLLVRLLRSHGESLGREKECGVAESWPSHAF